VSKVTPRILGYGSRGSELPANGVRGCRLPCRVYEVNRVTVTSVRIPGEHVPQPKPRYECMICHESRRFLDVFVRGGCREVIGVGCNQSGGVRVARDVEVEEAVGCAGSLGHALVDDNCTGFTTVVDVKSCASTQLGAEPSDGISIHGAFMDAAK